MFQNGYHLKEVKLGTADVTSQINNNILIISSVSSNQEITIIFEKDEPVSYTFQVYLLGNGEVKVNGLTIQNGNSVSVPVSEIKLEFLPND